MSLLGWGRYPQQQNQTLFADDQEAVNSSLADDKTIICYGNGRSYGDSALNHRILYQNHNDLILDFDDRKGILHCQAGLLLADILDVFVNKGWFLAVTPGTKYVTVGGAISADVHGKNQQLVGSFSDFVTEFRLMMADGSIVQCSKDNNVELFKATCGGMGLMGIILDATIQLKAIPSSYMQQKTIRTNNLQQTLAVFEQHSDASYSVAWIDCFAAGEQMGRGVVHLAEHAENAKYDWQVQKPFALPFYFAGLLLNKFSGRLFNALYYSRNKNRHQLVDINSFFYPLDGIKNWNKLYGKKGFIQYQFVLPKQDGLMALSEILHAIGSYEKGAFLAVLKLFGKGNDNYLSFPMEGYTLAVDFKVCPELTAFLALLDNMVLRFKGRFYLAKDARLDQHTFEAGYPQVDKFRKLRKKYALTTKFQSYQSERLGL